MNRRQLSQAYFLTKELEMWERKLREAEAKSIASPVITGMPFANTNLNSDPTAHTAMDVQRIRDMVETLRDNVIRQLREINEYISTLDDSFLRQIVHYRCYELMTWRQVSEAIGVGDEDSIRMYFNRNIK